MKNPYLSKEEVVEIFLSQVAAHLEQNYMFSPEDLETIATIFIMSATPKIAEPDRDWETTSSFDR